MNKNTQDTVNISFVCLILVLVSATIIFSGLLFATPFMIEWVVKLLVTTVKSLLAVL
jgi:hypothetical protein